MATDSVGRSREVDSIVETVRLIYRFMDVNAEIFDNRQLLAEGMPAPPKFTSYLQQCATRPADRSVYQQLLEDE